MALADKKEQAFAAHICDLLEIARKSYTARFSGFLDARQLCWRADAYPPREAARSICFSAAIRVRSV